MPVEEGQVIKFLKSSRHDGFQKGDIAHISRVMARYPSSTSDIYLADKDGITVWCIGSEVTPWNQLSLNLN